MSGPTGTPVRVAGLGYSFPGRALPTLLDLSFELAAESWTLLAGPSGCGKSTLLRALAGLIPRHTSGRMRGRVLLGGDDTRELSAAERARRVGLVLQSPDDQLCATTPAAEIAFGLENLGLPAAEIGARVEEALGRLGFEGAGWRSHQLSGGQKQRLILASIMAMRPGVLLLDEPLSQLDPLAAHELLEELDRLRKSGLTILMAEHRFDDLLPRVDRLLLLDRGRLAADLAATDRPAVEAALQRAGLDGRSLCHQGRWERIEPQEQTIRLSPPSPAAAPCESAVTGVPMPGVLTTQSPRGGRSAAAGSAWSLRIDGLSFRFPGQKRFVWQDLSFTLRPGERVAVVGPNASGKSTLLAVLAGLLRPTSGAIQECAESRPGGKRAEAIHRGLVMQNPDLMLFCSSVREELAFGPRQLGLSEAEVQSRVEAVGHLLSLAEMLDEPPLALSQGQRLRVAVGAMLTVGPDLLLLDEPTTGQDPRHVASTLAALSDWSRGSGNWAGPRASSSALLFSTHDLRAVARFADRVLVLGQCRLLADCRPDELLADEELLRAASLRGAGLSPSTALGQRSRQPRPDEELWPGEAVAAMEERP